MPADGITIDKTMCLHCGACVGACPVNAMFLHEVRIEFLNNCTECGICIMACPVGYIDYSSLHFERVEEKKRIREALA